MAEIFLLCGLPGSGKSTWAARRASETDAVVFNPDRWMIQRHGHHMPRELFDARLAECLQEIHAEAAGLAARHFDVVIDAGYWKRDQRRAAVEAVRVASAVNGVPLPRLTLHWFDVPLEELRRRLRARNGALPPDTFEITDAMLDQFAAWFEPPQADEGLAVVRHG